MKIICVGLNYADHAKEFNSPIPQQPVLFMKPETSVVLKNQPFFYPDFSNEIHYECEIVIRINKLGKHIQEKFAPTYFNEIGIGIDFTARDLQLKLKEAGLPWEISKAFDGSAAISQKFINVSEIEDIQNIDFRLDINGETVQRGNTGNMIFPINKIISYCSEYFTLKIGDLIFTGTPAGIGSIKIGDRIEAFIGDKKMLDIAVR